MCILKPIASYIMRLADDLITTRRVSYDYKNYATASAEIFYQRIDSHKSLFVAHLHTNCQCQESDSLKTIKYR